jgi:signal transduction histidine kinase
MSSRPVQTVGMQGRVLPRFTVRIRLTLLYTGLFAACGVILVAITYGLVATGVRGDLPVSADALNPPKEYMSNCRAQLGAAAGDDDRSAEAKCQAAYREAAASGAAQQRAETLANVLRYSLIALGAATALSALAGWVVAGRVLRPVHRLTAAARAASGRNLGARVALGGPRDELRELADTFDAMLDRLQAAFESQRRFIANASHELRTPLTVMRATVDVVLAKPAASADELARMGLDVRGAVDQAEALIEALLTLARSDRGLDVLEPADLADIVEDAVDAADPGDRKVHASHRPAPTVGDPILLGRLVANLLDNALRHNSPGGEVWLATYPEAGRAVLEVANTGQVLPTEAVEGLFEPFRRLCDRTGSEGFGLGLAIVAAIADAHGGEVVARARPDGGLSVRVALPGCF